MRIDRRELLAAAGGVGLAALSGCAQARRTGTLVFDPIPPDRPDDCPVRQHLGVEFPVPLEDEAVEALVREYEIALQADNDIDLDRLSVESVTLTEWSDNYIADLDVQIDREPEADRYAAAYYVGKELLLRSAADGTELPPDPRDGELLECRRDVEPL